MEEHPTSLKEFNYLFREIDGLYHEVSRKMGLSDSAFAILYQVWDMGDGCLQRDICKAASISKQTIHSAMRKLEQQGLLYLRPGKGREMEICLTEAGRSLIQEKIVPVAAIEEAAYGELTPKERQELYRLTDKYLEHFRRKVKEL